MDIKIVVIVILAILVTLGGGYILNDKYKEFRNDISINFYNAGYNKRNAEIINIAEESVRNECKDIIVSLYSGENIINLVDTRCFSYLLEDEESIKSYINNGYKQGILDIINISEEKVTAECVDPIIPLYSGDNTINLVDTRCLETVFKEIQKLQIQQGMQNDELQVNE